MQVRPIGSVESGKPVTNYLVANRHALPLLAPRPQVSLCSDGVLAASWLHCAVYRHVKAAQLPSRRLGCSRCQPFVRRRYVSGTPFPVPKKQTQKPVREAPQEEELCDFELVGQAQLGAVCVGGGGHLRGSLGFGARHGACELTAVLASSSATSLAIWSY